MTVLAEEPLPVAHFVRGIEFPATRDDLVTRAKENNAPESAIVAIASLPQEWFGSMDEVHDATEALAVKAK